MESKQLCFLCFEALENKVTNKNNNKVANAVIDPNNKDEYPLFVTWKIDGDQLRGCIGNFGKLPLYQGLMEYAVIAGTRDHRFEPITPEELPRLKCGVSLLYQFEKAENALDWEIGKHGIRLSIDGCNSTYLPEVAPEFGWTKEETLAHLARKGGFYKKYDKSALERSKVERYQSAKSTATWAEYQEWLQTH